MPALVIKDLNDWAVLWLFTGYDGYGQAMIGAPLQIPVRWLTRHSEALDAKGNTITLDATIYVAQDIAIGSHLWHGLLADWYGTGSGTATPDEMLCEVKTFSKTPDVKGRTLRRQVGVVRLHNKGAN